MPVEIKLSNARAEAVVRPDIGRVISFRRIGGDNRLWVAADPTAFGTPRPIYGGLKVMISPEVLWQQIRQEHRSDPATDGGSWTVMEQSGLHVKMQTFSPDLGVKVTWSIRLDAERPELFLNYEIKRTAANHFPVHLWTIAQVPLEGDLLMSRLPHVPNLYRNCIWAPKLDEYVEYLPESQAVCFSGSVCNEPLKIGTFGHWIAQINETEAFVIGVPRVERRPYVEGSNLQGFSYASKFPFYEMEHTGPLVALQPGEVFHTQEKWMLKEVPAVSRREQIGIIARAVEECDF
jgi:hypothetical protein